LANPRHGTWAFAVDMPSPNGKRKTMRRSGYNTRADARAALARVLECERAGVYLDDTQTVADYLVTWLDAKARRLKPTTVARYRDYLHNDLLPAFGAVRLERLTHQHVDQFVHTQLAAGRGAVTVRRCIATLSSALNDAIRQRRLTHNAARYTTIPMPHRAGLRRGSQQLVTGAVPVNADTNDIATTGGCIPRCGIAYRASYAPVAKRRHPRARGDLHCRGASAPETSSEAVTWPDLGARPMRAGASRTRTVGLADNWPDAEGGAKASWGRRWSDRTHRGTYGARSWNPGAGPNGSSSAGTKRPCRTHPDEQ
jgi:hypothetical protein